LSLNKENKGKVKSNVCLIKDCSRQTHRESKYCIFHASAEEKTEEEFKKALKEYIQEIKEEGKDYDFEGFIFVGNINFKEDLNIIVFKKANFRNATFKGEADFKGATFKGEANFTGATFKQYADFTSATFEGDAGFVGATFEREANFTGAIFKQYAYFTSATFEGDANFTGATFEGKAGFGKTTFKQYAYFTRAIFKRETDFYNNTFKQYAYFTSATFEGNANFWKTTFMGKTDFGKTTFEQHASFMYATFKGKADFKGTTFEGGADLDATFEGEADFAGATFKGKADFAGATFKGDTDFSGATFEGNADFADATFEGNADFADATFEGNADFADATFKGDADFADATFKGDADFSIKAIGEYISFYNTLFNQGRTLVIKTTDVKNEVTIDFEKVCLENVYLELFLGEKTLINFTKALLRSTTIEKDQIENHIFQKEKEMFSRAQQVYLLLKNNFHSIGKYKDESWAFTKERDMEKFSYKFINSEENHKYQDASKEKNLFYKCILNIKFYTRWLFSKKSLDLLLLKLSSFVYGYGENPWYVIRFASIVIFLFAIILNFSGIVTSDRTNLIIEFIKESQGDKYTLRYLGPILGNFLNCLYFSVVTFTTLGYGDFQPAVGLSRFFVSLESIIGAITMALFVYTFARRTGGR